MARCYQLTEAQSQAYDADPWRSIAIERDVMDWQYRHNIREEVVVITPQHAIAFALTWQGERA
jgi:hypothetical protein